MDTQITEKERKAESHAYALACFEDILQHKGDDKAERELEYRDSGGASPEYKLALEALIAMSEEDYPNTQVGDWKIKIHAYPRGYFEHQITGCSGSLEFEGKTLVDYDGVYELPKRVIQGLRNLGFIVDAVTANEERKYICANGHESNNPGLCTQERLPGIVCGMFPRLICGE
jgi:hypothetical protein